ncbi:MAG: ABC transporter ATP-binding protein [Termitinemataceae bacterium]|nr:MAG: ABC transporter ATP-binding protein [Termitinemataceae bacterium]
MSQLELKNISYMYADNFGNGILTLAGINFSVEKFETICLLGANGSGKSTLLEIIASCIKPTSGQIILDDTKTGIVFQDPDNQFFMPTVWEDVAFGIMKKGMSADHARHRALTALKNVEAEHLADRLPHKLSGGEKQRAALASILIMEPDILLLDEPTAALDPRARKNIILLLKNLPCTKIIASHDLDMALDIASRIIFLHKGKIAADCQASGLLQEESFLQSIGLELPLGISKY